MQILLILSIYFIIFVVQIYSKPTPTILDTDIGTHFDDQLALTYILSNPSIFDLKLVICSTYNTTARGQVVAKTLATYGRFDVPIALGRSIGKEYMPEFKWAQDYTLEQFQQNGGIVYQDGEEALLKEMQKANPDNIYNIIEISPQTSLGDVLERVDPQTLRSIRLFAMAGSIHTGYGNTSQPSQEFNILIDLLASQEVFNAPWAYFGLAPLDTTIFMQFFGSQWQKFLSYADQNQHVKLVVDSFTTWYNNGGDDYGALQPYGPKVGTSTMYDVLAAYLAGCYPNCPTVINKNLPLIVTVEGYTLINATLGKPVDVCMRFSTTDPYTSTKQIGNTILSSIISSQRKNRKYFIDFIAYINY